MNMIRSQRGQAIILLAFAIVALVGFAALAIDGGRVLSDKRHAQNAADNSAFAAALAKIKGQDYVTAAQNRAISNGYTNGQNATIVAVNLCSETGITCPGVPNGAVLADYIRVRITSVVPTTFARVLGRDKVTNVVEAIAHAQGVTIMPYFSGAAMVAMKQSGCGICANGNVFLDINGSGAFSNSTTASGDCSMDFEGNGTYTADGGYTVASGGALCKTGNVNVSPNQVTQGSQLPYPPDIDIPAPTINCSGTGSVNTTTKVVSPGTFNSHLDLGSNGNYTFEPGDYCFNGGVTINGNINVTANNVNFRINASSFQINGNTTFSCSNMIVYGFGGTGMEFNGNGSNNCTGVTFYMKSGKVTWNGNVSNTFKAPTSGPYKGLLLYMPYPNSAALTINGNSGNQLTGSIIAPAAPITINGNSGTSGLHTQIIGNSITLNGNSNTTINYDPAEQFIPPASPKIELTK